MSEELAVYDADETGLTPITDATLIGLAEQAEKRIDAMNKIKRIAIKLTNKHDWTDQSGKPYLQVSGAEKIARMFGISWRISEPVEEKADGGHFAFTYRGNFSLAGATIDAIGTRSSKDGFFKKYGYSNGDKTELPASEIDRGDVKKAAYTNCIGNGITRLLGLRNMTYEDLQEFSGISQDMIQKVGYKSKGKVDAGIASEGAQTVTVIVTDIRKKEGKNAKGKAYVRFTIKDSANIEYATFSESFAKTAKEGKGAGIPVKITFKAGQYGNDIEGLVLAEQPPEKEPGDES